MTFRRIPVAGAHVDASVSGSGEPILFIQTALDTEELVPLTQEPLLAEHHRVIDCRRRGYGSSPAEGPGSVVRDAEDALAVLQALDAMPAHVVGVSYSAAVALELAASAPGVVATLTLIEPPPRHGPSADEFLQANDRLRQTFERDGVGAALDAFTRVLGVTPWLEERRSLPRDEVERLEHDAYAFFARDIPALVEWHFNPARAAVVTQPVLYLGGTASHPWFAEVGRWVKLLLPQTEDHLIAGAGHDLSASHSREVAEILRHFITSVATCPQRSQLPPR